MSDELNPDDFGLGSDFDDALNAASDEGGGDSVSSSVDDNRLSKTDFSKLKMLHLAAIKVSRSRIFTLQLSFCRLLIQKPFHILKFSLSQTFFCGSKIKLRGEWVK